MVPASKPPPPIRPPFDSEFGREASAVRSTRAEVPPSAAGRIGARTARIDQLVHLATTLLGRLAPLDPRARLLASAVMRRDEVLLEAVLSKLDAELVPLAGAGRGKGG
ncbi:MAG: hypothetical protein FJ104_04845 [Deltaproteobacteria bacterium]|nr:hypothetical protein [Deltaproteobacteria bacterium]